MSSKTGTICIVLTAFAFGTMEISLKIAGSAFTPFQLTVTSTTSLFSFEVIIGAKVAVGLSLVEVFVGKP